MIISCDINLLVEGAQVNAASPELFSDDPHLMGRSSEDGRTTEPRSHGGSTELHLLGERLTKKNIGAAIDMLHSQSAFRTRRT